MSYAAKIEELIAERDELRRWKSTHAPRIEALEGLLKHAQLEAHAGREAIATLASEREANAILTAEVESLRRDAERYRKLRDKAPAGWYVGPDIEVDEAGGVHGYANHFGRDLDVAVDSWPAVATKDTP